MKIQASTPMPAISAHSAKTVPQYSARRSSTRRLRSRLRFRGEGSSRLRRRRRDGEAADFLGLLFGLLLGLLLGTSDGVPMRSSGDSSSKLAPPRFRPSRHAIDPSPAHLPQRLTVI